MGGGKAVLFLKKKNQKDFFMLGMGAGLDNAHVPESKEFFGSFFQKRTASLFTL